MGHLYLCVLIVQVEQTGSLLLGRAGHSPVHDGGQGRLVQQGGPGLGGAGDHCQGVQRLLLFSDIM